MGPRPDWETMAAAAQATVLFPFCMNSDCLYNCHGLSLQPQGGRRVGVFSLKQSAEIKNKENTQVSLKGRFSQFPSSH